MRVANVNLDEEKVTVMGLRSKSRSTPPTFISPETAQTPRDFIRLEHLTPEDWLFPLKHDRKKAAGRNALYSLIHRTLNRTGLRKKQDPASTMYELHPHAFRKYFFTRLISASVDRGVAEYLMGHKFGLDNSYLRTDVHDSAANTTKPPKTSPSSPTRERTKKQTQRSNTYKQLN